MGAREGLPGFGGKRRANGALEAEILSLLHSCGTALTPGEIAGRLASPPAHTTVATTLARLSERGVLHRSRRGRSYAYAPAMDEAGLTARNMHRTLTAGKDRASILTHFVGELTPDEEKLLRALLDDRD